MKRRVKKKDEQGIYGDESYDILLFGYNRIGHDILETLKKMKRKYLVIDYNPDTIQALNKQKIPCKYGDANDLELLGDLNWSSVKMVVSTVPDLNTNLMLVKKANSMNEHIITIAVSHQVDESLSLYEAGATYVIMPHFLGGRHASMMIEKKGLNLNSFLQDRIFNVENLKHRRDIGHEHPKTGRTQWNQ